MRAGQQSLPGRHQRQHQDQCAEDGLAQLLTILQNAATNPGDVQVAIVPFAKDVNVGTGHVSDTWIDWTDWSKNFPAGAPANTAGPGDPCPSGWSSYGCVTAPGSTTGTSTIPLERLCLPGIGELFQFRPGGSLL